MNRYNGNLVVLCDLVGGYNGKNHDGPEEGLLLLLLTSTYARVLQRE